MAGTTEVNTGAVYPRTYGEHYILPFNFFFPVGLSPYLRGTQTHV
ncbi:conserved hypothetical protein [Xenorhabdus bovienii str. Jollieti]|uniref:Uncharacterized protein n=1 Tax=Xenorhabdus bovienii (strain SS-2004) TaxID=406818 RepID=D3V5A8_XENBS|nr:conserved hypothetical protein [Xenorhabdus bovienii SS-2004]CDH28615.1 conserved hypothetical protein [Xenorhabdus bovienii str. Jollieti]